LVAIITGRVFSALRLSLAEKTQLGLGHEGSVCISKVAGGNCALVRNWIDPAVESLFSDAAAMHILTAIGSSYC